MGIYCVVLTVMVARSEFFGAGLATWLFGFVTGSNVGHVWWLLHDRQVGAATAPAVGAAREALRTLDGEERAFLVVERGPARLEVAGVDMVGWCATGTGIATTRTAGRCWWRRGRLRQT